MDHGDAYTLYHSIKTRVAYIIGAIGWVFQITTIALGAIAIARYFFFK